MKMMKMVIQNQKEAKVKNHPVPKRVVRAKIRISNHKIILKNSDSLI